MFMLQRTDIKLLLILAIPLILSGLVESSVGFFSTLFLAHLGQDELAAGALVNWVFATLMVVLWGVLSAVSVAVAHKHGAQDHGGVGQVFRDSLWLAVLFSIPASLLIWNLAPLLVLLGQSPAVVRLAIPYLHALSWGLLPDFAGIVLLQLLIGLGQTRTSMGYTMVWVPMNIMVNYILVFGKCGFPAFGLAGLGWGMTFSFWVTSVGLLGFLWLRPFYGQYCRLLLTLFHWGKIWELVKNGLPIGLMYCVEIAFFTVMMLCMGHLGSKTLAANQVAMQYLGLFIAVVFAIAQAITVRVSNRLGAKEPIAAHRGVSAGLLIMVVIIGVIAVAEYFGATILIGFDFNRQDPGNTQLIAQATFFLELSLVVLFTESIRFALFGALRGLKDTRFTLLVSLISFWGIALPLGYLFAYKLDLGGAGFWYGFMISSSLSVLTLFWRYRVKIEQQLRSPKTL